MEQLKIIFIDDDIYLGDFVSNILESEYKYKVHFQNTTIGINPIIEGFAPNIIILDVEIGDQNGIETAKDILAKHPYIPILFVSSHSEEDFITRGIDVGGNAYISKPLSIPILVSYIKRFATNKTIEQSLIISDYKLDLETNNLFYENKLLKKLSPFEKNALEILMQNPNQIVRKEQFADKFWGHSLKKQNIASIHNTLSKLRDLLSENQSIKIDTVRGVGYILHC
ncbi:response regulator transcription factor [Marinifilum fragile]|uniref:response regulator transcription factor n=1 Tax=Marinifilum fragile TaxID=570161 RepID=UPI002AA83F69|nr:response regulator transcription factor [Marinifilum fragile]